MSGVLLVTGFEPYGGDPRNPSAEVMEALRGARFGESKVEGALLPVDCQAMPGRVRGLIDGYGGALAGVVHLGLANGRSVISLERVAINCLDFPIPDNGGHQPLGEPVVEGGPAAYFSTMPLRHSLAALRQHGIPSMISNTAGTYLCNQTMYTTLHLLAELGRTVPAGFVHVPYLPDQVAQRGEVLPSLSFEVLRKAVELILDQVSTVPAGVPSPAIVGGAIS